MVLSPNLAEVILALGYEMQLCGKGAACTEEDLSVLPDMTMDDPQSILGVGGGFGTHGAISDRRAKERAERCGVEMLPPSRQQRAARLCPPVSGGWRFYYGRERYERGEKIAEGIFQYHRRHQPPDSPDGYARFPSVIFMMEGGVVTGDTLEGKLIRTLG